MPTSAPPPDGNAQLQQEVERLRAEVARLSGSSPDESARDTSGVPASKTARSGVARTIISAVLITLACVLAPLSAVSVWARGEVTDTERYVAAVAPLASDPTIQAAVTTRITDEIFTYIDIQTLADDAVATVTDNRQLTPAQSGALTALTGPLVSGVESFTNDQVTKVVASPQFASAWMEANTIARRELVALLSGNTSALTVEGNAVTLDLGDVLAQVKDELVQNGFTIADRIPAVNTSVTIFQSDNVGKVQAAFSALNTLGFWLPIVAAGLAVAGVVVANMRRTAVLGIGIGLALASVFTAVALAALRNGYISELPNTVNVSAATVLFDTILAFLKSTVWAGFVAGIVLALGAVLTGQSSLAVGVRRLATSAAAVIQRALASVGATMTGVRTWVAAQATGLRVASTLIALVVVLGQRYKTPDLVIGATAALLVALFVIQVFASGVADDDEAGSSPA